MRKVTKQGRFDVRWHGHLKLIAAKRNTTMSHLLDEGCEFVVRRYLGTTDDVDTFRKSDEKSMYMKSEDLSTLLESIVNQLDAIDDNFPKTVDN